MTTPSEPLGVTPTDITFDNNYSMNQLRKLILTNPDKTLHVVFKIKLSHRDIFTITPSMGIIKPGDHDTINIVIKPITWTPAIAEKNRMLIQTLNVEEPTSDLKSVFDQGQMPLDQIVNIQLPCP